MGSYPPCLSFLTCKMRTISWGTFRGWGLDRPDARQAPSLFLSSRTPTSAWSTEMRNPYFLQGQKSQGKGNVNEGLKNPPYIRRKIIGQGKAFLCFKPQKPHPFMPLAWRTEGFYNDSTEGLLPPAQPSSLGGLWAAASRKTFHFLSHFLCVPHGLRVGTDGWEPRTPTLLHQYQWTKLSVLTH